MSLCTQKKSPVGACFIRGGTENISLATHRHFASTSHFSQIRSFTGRLFSLQSFTQSRDHNIRLRKLQLTRWTLLYSRPQRCFFASIQQSDLKAVPAGFLRIQDHCKSRSGSQEGGFHLLGITPIHSSAFTVFNDHPKAVLAVLIPSPVLLLRRGCLLLLGLNLRFALRPSTAWFRCYLDQINM